MTLEQCAIDNETLRDIDNTLHDQYPEMVYGGDGPWNDYGGDYDRGAKVSGHWNDPVVDESDDDDYTF